MSKDEWRIQVAARMVDGKFKDTGFLSQFKDPLPGQQYQGNHERLVDRFSPDVKVFVHRLRVAEECIRLRGQGIQCCCVPRVRYVL